MKKLLALLLLFPFFMANGQMLQKNFIDQNYIQVTGSSEIEIVPDEIYVSIVIREKDNRGRTSVEEQENKMLMELSKIGIPKDNLKILDYNTNFKNYFLRKKEVLKTKAYQLKVQSGLELAKAYQALEQIGIANVNIMRTDHSKLEKYKLEAKVKAIKVAKTNAKSYAEAIDQSIGKALYIEEQIYYVRPRYANYSKTMNMAADVEEAVNDIDFRKIKLESKVLVRFALN